MRYEPVSSELFVLNRKRFADKLPAHSIGIFTSNDIMPTNADGSMGFKQQSDFFYLSGIDQEDSYLIIAKGSDENTHKAYLFIKETNEQIAIWEGDKLSKTEAHQISGIEHIYWEHEFESISKNLVFDYENIYLNTNEHARNSNPIETKSDRLLKECKTKFPLHTFKRAAPLLQSLRMIKSEWEIELIQKACNITEKAFRRLLPYIKSGTWEYEIEAEITHEFLMHKSRGSAYSPIIASGANACILHYIQNNRMCKEGDLILMDFGCEYANYAADLTRCVPANGKFSHRQKQVYTAVLKILKFAQSQLTAGNNFNDYNKAVVACVEEALVELGLISMTDLKNQDSKNPLYKKYFMHGVSHFLGLDVHDVGDKKTIFSNGMVLTCEPGIYIRAEGIGVRLENDILIQQEKPVNLMKNIPIEIDEIEFLMREGK
jgi:Xaa-Pro aminopeptidase